MSDDEAGRLPPDVPPRFPPELIYRAAQLYYLEDATQAEVATRLNTSRPTVSRLLAEARSTGIVRIEVRDPGQDSSAELAKAVARRLDLRAAYVTPSSAGLQPGPLLAGGVGRALQAASLQPGDAVLVSSGATLHAVAQQTLPSLRGVLVAPTVGGVDEQAEYYQTNEITRTLAVKVHGTPVLLYAPLQPSENLFRVLMEDDSIKRVTTLWGSAQLALLGVGGPPRTRQSRPSALAQPDVPLNAAVGDICARPFDREGRAIPFPGGDRLVAMDLDDLARIPHTVAVAVGVEKVPAILAATRSGWVNTLVTDAPTARALLSEAPA